MTTKPTPYEYHGSNYQELTDRAATPVVLVDSLITRRRKIHFLFTPGQTHPEIIDSIPEAMAAMVGNGNESFLLIEEGIGNPTPCLHLHCLEVFKHQIDTDNDGMPRYSLLPIRKA